MPRVVIIGAGFSGCAAALAAAKAGAEVVLIEKTDMLAGLAVLTGVLDGNGNLTAKLEAKAMGGGEMFEACESVTLHEIDRIEMLGLEHVRLFNVLAIERVVARLLADAGVKVQLKTRAKGVKMKGDSIARIILSDQSVIDGASFVDASGGSGTVAQCTKYGYGCVMCIMRCPTFGNRVSISEQAGVKDLIGRRSNGKIGALSSAFNLVKDSLSSEIRSELEKKGYLLIPMPRHLIDYEKLGMITASENARPEFVENMRVVDNGYAKVSVHGFMPLEQLHSVAGFENARMADPLSGGVGNAVRCLAMAPRDNGMRVHGLANLYCAGEKAGPQSGLPAAIITGLLAGHNAVRNVLGKGDLILPRNLASGDFIAFEKEKMESAEGLNYRYGFGGRLYFDRLKELGLYSIQYAQVRAKVEKEKLSEVFAQRLV